MEELDADTTHLLESVIRDPIEVRGEALRAGIATTAEIISRKGAER
jgi:hypothetical protein